MCTYLPFRSHLISVPPAQDLTKKIELPLVQAVFQCFAGLLICIVTVLLLWWNWIFVIHDFSILLIILNNFLVTMVNSLAFFVRQNMMFLITYQFLKHWSLVLPWWLRKSGFKVAEHSFGSLWVYVIFQIMARKRTCISHLAETWQAKNILVTNFLIDR